MPYRLYALSNAGSMFALLSYPVLFEPVFTTHQQAWMWSVAYGVFIVLCGVRGVPHGQRPGAGPEPMAGPDEPEAVPPGPRQYAMWLLCPPAPRCCCWPSPITCRRTWRPSRFYGCCR